MRTKKRIDKRGRVRRTAEQRQVLIEAYRANGLSQAGFCRREGIHPTTFNHWLRTVGRPSSPKTRSTRGRFARVEVPWAKPAALEIELRSGVVIRVHEVERLGDLAEFIRQMQAAGEAPRC